ncbi:MAG: copper amine oxidase N-terminal domain-containing protein [Armatimonadota bacterium]
MGFSPRLLVVLLLLLNNTTMLPTLAQPVQGKDTTPQTLMMNGVMMVPAAFLANWLGAALTLDQEADKVSLSRNGTRLTVTLYATAATNGAVRTLDAPPVCVAGIFYLPLRSTVSVFGGVTTWEQKKREAVLSARGRETIRLPLRGRIVSVSGDFDGDKQAETAYGAYLLFTSPQNRWSAGRSVSNPLLPTAWLVKNGKMVWSQHLDQSEIGEFGQADLDKDGHPELWLTTRFYGADYVGNFFHTYRWNEQTFSDIITNPDGNLLYMSNGGLLVWLSHQPTQLILFNGDYGTRPHVENPVALEVTTYTWKEDSFLPASTLRTIGAYNGDPVNTLRAQFYLPLTDQSAKAIRQGEVAFQ